LSALLLTACSSSDDKPSASSSTSSTPTVLAPIAWAQVIRSLDGSGYTCNPDAAYVTCISGGVSVAVLTGDQPRPPVVSLNAAGPVDTSSAAIAKVLPQVLEQAHINNGAEIAAWFGQQKGGTAAQMTAGDWLVEYSAEVDTEEPGTHLTLTDKLCKVNCQAE
jgi:hypothetical protein